LIPRDKFHLTIPVEVADGLVVMFPAAGVFDMPTRPGLREIRIWILPPPDCVAAGVLAQDNIQVTIPVDIAIVAARLRIFSRIVNHKLVPTSTVVLIPDHRRRSRTFTNDEIVNAVFVDVQYQTTRLLLAFVRDRHISG